MLNSLRRIRRNLLMSNNARSHVLYAFGQIGLVMVGILLALQVSNWDENRKRQDQLGVILQTIKEDLARDTLVAEGIIRFYDTTNK